MGLFIFGLCAIYLLVKWISPDAYEKLPTWVVAVTIQLFGAIMFARLPVVVAPHTIAISAEDSSPVKAFPAGYVGWPWDDPIPKGVVIESFSEFEIVIEKAPNVIHEGNIWMCGTQDSYMRFRSFVVEKLGDEPSNGKKAIDAFLNKEFEIRGVRGFWDFMRTNGYNMGATSISVTLTNSFSFE